MLAGCNISSLGLEAAKEELSELVSLANANSPSGPSSSLSELTEMSDLQMQKQGTRPAGNCFLPHQPQLTDSSMDSCLTSSESSERKDEKLQSSHVNSAYDAERSGACALKPIEINSNNNNLSKIHLSNRASGGKRTRRSDSSDDTGTEKQISEPLPYQENFDNHLKRFRLSGDIDLNSQYQSEMDVGGQKLDLNCWIWGALISSSSVWILGNHLLMTQQVALGFGFYGLLFVWNCWCSYCYIWIQVLWKLKKEYVISKEEWSFLFHCTWLEHALIYNNPAILLLFLKGEKKKKESIWLAPVHEPRNMKCSVCVILCEAQDTMGDKQKKKKPKTIYRWFWTWRGKLF